MDLRISTYEDLRKCILAFQKGAMTLLFLVGDKGVAKTTIVKKVLKPLTNKEKSPVIWIDGGALSAFQLYLDLYKYRDRTIVLDDTDQLYTDRTLIRLMKCLCQTEKVRTIGWHTANYHLASEGVPKEFQTSSRVLVIANFWRDISDHVRSLEDRGLLVTFVPPVNEILAEGRKWFRDKIVMKWIDDHRPFIQSISMRNLVVASEMRKGGLTNWVDALKDSLGIRDMLIVHELLGDDRFSTDEERIVRFHEQTAKEGHPGLSRAQFFILKAKLRQVLHEPTPDPESQSQPWLPGTIPMQRGVL